MDWKDALGALRDEVPQAPEENNTFDAADGTVSAENKSRQTGKLNVVIEKKGRGGKPATIIEGFDIPDDEITALASRLKQKLGIGGSARGGEILLQGECRDKVITLLRSFGFKA